MPWTYRTRRIATLRRMITQNSERTIYWTRHHERTRPLPMYHGQADIAASFARAAAHCGLRLLDLLDTQESEQCASA